MTKVGAAGIMRTAAGLSRVAAVRIAAGLMLIGAGLCGGAALANDNAAKGPAADGTLPSLVKIAGEGAMNSHAMEFLTQLSDDVGARVTGSPADHKAEDWGVAKMNEIGLANVHKEKYTIWKGWTRGTADAELLTRAAQAARRRHGLDWVDRGGRNRCGCGGGEPVRHRQRDQECVALQRKSRADGDEGEAGWAARDSVFHPLGRFQSRGRSGRRCGRDWRAGRRKIDRDEPDAHGNPGIQCDFQIPIVSMTGEDQGQLERYLERGITPRVHFNIQNTFTSGPVETANVVGEIRGTGIPSRFWW